MSLGLKNLLLKHPRLSVALGEAADGAREPEASWLWPLCPSPGTVGGSHRLELRHYLSIEPRRELQVTPGLWALRSLSP